MANLDDYRWLVSSEAGELLAAESGDQRPLLQRLSSLRTHIGAERAALVVETAEQRRRGRAKFGPLARRLFGTAKQWEQATDGWIAAYKADRFAAAGARSVHDFCCGMGGDLLGLAGRVTAIGWDHCGIAALLAQHNLGVGVSNSSKCTVRCLDVEDVRPHSSDAWHVDPDRRSEGRRTTAPELHVPPPRAIDSWRATCPHGAVKLAPAARPWGAWAEEAQWEWISRDRECRQLVAWFGDLQVESSSPGRRRATRITAVDHGHFAYEVATFAAAVSPAAKIADEPAGFLMEPDPAVIAADLVGALANDAGLSTLGAGGAYLTGEAPGASPLLAAFAVEASLPLRIADASKHLAARNVGAVEVKVRGVKRDPAAFRRQLKLRGDHQACVFLTRIGRRETAIVARRVER